MISQSVYQFFENNFDFIKKECGREINGLLFLFDRKEDPVTPLLNQWTYQAMIHELIGINNNVIEIKYGSKTDQFVISDMDDRFFASNINNDFGDVASRIKELVERFNKEQERMDKKVETIEEIKKMVEKLPEKKKESAEVTKHTNIVYELTELMQKRNLLDLSSLEQDMACSDNRSNHYSRVVSIIKSDKYTALDKAKIFLIYSIRYEGDNSIQTLKQIMQDNNAGGFVEYLEYLLMYSGKNKRHLDVFNNKDFFSMSTNKLMSAFKNIPNVFTQHSSYMPTIIEKILKGKDLKEVDTLLFPNQREKYNKIIVFNFGGITYEESRDCTLLSKNNKDIPIIVGGSTIHNSKRYEFLN
jgi:vacuolar protein sorting-associated protein 45